MDELPVSSIGRIEQAKRFAVSRFDEWNDVTGFVAPHTGYYYEFVSLVEEAAEFGFGVAHGQTREQILERVEKLRP